MTLPISVIIPCYKQEQWLTAAQQSARAAGAGEVLTYFDDGMYRAGVCFARNQMIETANYDLIFALDADDRLYRDALQRLYDAWKPGTWIYADTYTEIDEDENIIGEQHHPPPGMIHRKNLTYASFLFHKDDWHKAGGYDPTFEFSDEDWAFQVALVAHGVRPVRIEGPPLYKRMLHEHSRTEMAVRYFAMAKDMLKTKYPHVMKD